MSIQNVKEEPEEEELQLESINQLEVTEVFNTLEKTVKTALISSVVEGGRTLAKIHHHLFQEAISGSEKARLSLLFLKSKLHKIVKNIENYKIGTFIHCYSRHWFRYFLVIEAKAYEYLSWLSFQPEAKINYKEIFINLNLHLAPLGTYNDFSEKDHKAIIKILRKLRRKESSVIIGNQLHDWVFRKMRHTIEVPEDKSVELLNFQKVFHKAFELNTEFDEIFHEYAKAWFRHSLELKHWFITLEQKMDQDKMERMFKGYITSQFNGKPFSQIIKYHKRKIIIKKQT